MIVALAGHVDHGKTSLVRQLTGVNTDRLEEERRRGLTIELGFAYRRTTRGQVIGFIDVPGHRRFINTMIAGVGGVDLGMLVIDAREGVMPQTLEHIRVMRLLGVDEILVVISKIDRVPLARVATVRESVGGLLPASRVFSVSSHTGAGLAVLSDALDARAEEQPERAVGGYFRLSVDRAFVLKGVGLIVTGTAIAGCVRVGETLRLFTGRSGVEGLKVRVRGIHSQGEDSAVGQVGQRCALNLSGDLVRDDIQRGNMLADARCIAPGLRFDASLQLLDESPFRPRQLGQVKLHHGARRLRARLCFLDDVDGGAADEKSVALPAPGRLVQFILHEPLQVCWGDRFLIQDDGESVILGGGVVLGPDAPRWHKSRGVRLDQLRAMSADAPRAVLARLLRVGAPPVDLRRFRASLNLRKDELDALLAESAQWRAVRLRHGDDDWLLSGEDWSRWRAHLLRQLAEWQRQHPMDTGMPEGRLLHAPGSVLPRAFLTVALDSLVREGYLHLVAGRLRSADWQPVVPPAVEEAWQRLRSFLLESGFRIPLLSEIERQLRLAPAVQSAVIGMALKAGDLHRIGPRRVTLPEVLLRLAAEINRLVERQESFTVIEAKTHLGLGRDPTIEILEYFDSVHFTRREGNDRRVQDASLPQRIFV